MMDMEIDTSEMERAMVELFRESSRTAKEVVTFNAQDLLRKLAWNSPRRSGNLRAGWIPGWRAIDLKGAPYTRRQEGVNMIGKGKKKRQYIAEGTVVDHRIHELPAIEFKNTSHLIHAGKKLYYPHVRHGGADSIADQTMRQTAQDLNFKWTDKYQKLLAKHSAR